MGLRGLFFQQQSTAPYTKCKNGKILLLILSKLPVANAYILSRELAGNFARPKNPSRNESDHSNAHIFQHCQWGDASCSSKSPIGNLSADIPIEQGAKLVSCESTWRRFVRSI